MFALIGFLTFALVWLYREQDIFQPLREKVEGWLVQHGWVWTANAMLKRRTKVAALWRFAWKVISCPYCLGMYVAFGATWYALGEHPWHRLFWITWLGGYGVHYFLTGSWQLISTATTTLDTVDEMFSIEPPSDEGERAPAPEDAET